VVEESDDTGCNGGGRKRDDEVDADEWLAAAAASLAARRPAVDDDDDDDDDEEREDDEGDGPLFGEVVDDENAGTSTPSWWDGGGRFMTSMENSKPKIDQKNKPFKKRKSRDIKQSHAHKSLGKTLSGDTANLPRSSNEHKQQREKSNERKTNAAKGTIVMTPVCHGSDGTSVLQLVKKF